MALFLPPLWSPRGQLLEEITEIKFWTKINHMQSGVLWHCSLMCFWKRSKRELTLDITGCAGYLLSALQSRSPSISVSWEAHPVLWRASLQLWDPGTSSYVQPMQTPWETRGWGGLGVCCPLSFFLAESSWDGWDLLLKVMAGGWCWGGHSSLCLPVTAPSPCPDYEPGVLPCFMLSSLCLHLCE